MSGARWKVVVVDANPEAVAEICRLLFGESDRRLEFVGATSGAEAIRHCLDPEGGPPDCLILDDDLPDMKTLEVLDALREGREMISCPVVILTRGHHRELRRMAFERGVGEIVGKSWLTAEVLTHAVEDAIDRQAIAGEFATGMAALRAGEARSLELIEAIPQVVWTAGRDGIVRFGDGRIAEYTGLPEVPAGSVGWAAIVHPDDVEPLEKLWAKARNEAAIFEAKHRVRRPDGTFRWNLNRALPVRHWPGGECRWFGTCTDIHDESSRSEALRASEERLRRFIADAPVALAMLDREMRYVVASHRWLGDLRMPDQDLIGRDFYRVISDYGGDPEVAERWRVIHRRCLAGAVETCEEECVKHADGSKDWVRWGVRPWHDLGGEIGGIIIFYDVITARKQAEGARQESERMARSILDSLSSNIAVLDEQGVVITVNRSWITFAEQNGGVSGVTEGANYLAVCDSSGKGGAAGAAEFASGVRDVLAGRRDFFTLEYPCDGPEEKRWFSVKVLPFVGEGPRRVVVNHVDVTDRKRAEDALRAYAERLESLHAIDLAILSARSPEEIAGAALSHLRRLVPCGSGAAVLYHFEGDEIEVINSIGPSREWHPPGTRFPKSLSGQVEIEALRRGQAVVVNDTRESVSTRSVMASFRAIGLRSYILVALMDRGELFGSLMLGSEIALAYTPEHVELIRDKANLLSIAIRQALLSEEVRAAKRRMESLSRRLIRAEEEERRRIALELHDEIGQSLTAVKIHLQVIGEQLDDPDEVRTRLEESIGLIDRTLRQARDLSLDLRPSLLDDMGLVAALRSLVHSQARIAGFSAEFLPVAIPPGFRAGLEIETACYRVAQEALTNVVRHAGAKAVEVELHLEKGMIRLLVRDDGEGFDPSEARSRAERGASLGVLGMHERVELLGGRFFIRSASGRGTKICAEFPLTPTPRPESEASDGVNSYPPGR